MKNKFLYFLLIALLLIPYSFISAQDDAPSAPFSGDKEYVEGAIDKIPLDEQGELDDEQIGEYKSKAEERIEEINEWMDENASWLKWVFGMVPEVSWLFAINFFVMLVFFTGMVLNAPSVFQLSNQAIARIVGLGIFVLLLFVKVWMGIATWFYNLLTTWWGHLIIIGALILAIVFQKPLTDYVRKHVEKGAKSKEEFDRQKLHGDVEVAEEFTKAITGK